MSTLLFSLALAQVAPNDAPGSVTMTVFAPCDRLNGWNVDYETTFAAAETQQYRLDVIRADGAGTARAFLDMAPNKRGIYYHGSHGLDGRLQVGCYDDRGVASEEVELLQTTLGLGDDDVYVKLMWEEDYYFWSVWMTGEAYGSAVNTEEAIVVADACLSSTVKGDLGGREFIGGQLVIPAMAGAGTIQNTLYNMAGLGKDKPRRTLEDGWSPHSGNVTAEGGVVLLTAGATTLAPTVLEATPTEMYLHSFEPVPGKVTFDTNAAIGGLVHSGCGAVTNVTVVGTESMTFDVWGSPGRAGFMALTVPAATHSSTTNATALDGNEEFDESGHGPNFDDYTWILGCGVGPYSLWEHGPKPLIDTTRDVLDAAEGDVRRSVGVIIGTYEDPWFEVDGQVLEVGGRIETEGLVAEHPVGGALDFEVTGLGTDRVHDLRFWDGEVPLEFHELYVSSAPAVRTAALELEERQLARPGVRSSVGFELLSTGNADLLELSLAVDAEIAIAAELPQTTLAPGQTLRASLLVEGTEPGVHTAEVSVFSGEKLLDTRAFELTVAAPPVIEAPAKVVAEPHGVIEVFAFDPSERPLTIAGASLPIGTRMSVEEGHVTLVLPGAFKGPLRPIVLTVDAEDRRRDHHHVVIDLVDPEGAEEAQETELSLGFSTSVFEFAAPLEAASSVSGPLDP